MFMRVTRRSPLRFNPTEEEKRFPADFAGDERRKGSDRKERPPPDFEAVQQENESLRKIIGE